MSSLKEKAKTTTEIVKWALEIKPGNLVIPLTCSLHADQEEEIRKKSESK
jgi:hypothetical protein